MHPEGDVAWGDTSELVAANSEWDSAGTVAIDIEP